jgi:type VI secretion system protein ImpH
MFEKVSYMIMINKKGLTDIDIKLELFKKGHSFSFEQVIRLINHFIKNKSFDEKTIKIKPNLSLSFPIADVERIEDKDNYYLITMNFLGLYGFFSPIPLFYTESLMEDVIEGEYVVKDFLDVINQRLYDLLYQSMQKYYIFFQVIERNDFDYIERILCLSGLGNNNLNHDISNSLQLIPYTGLLNQHPRSAFGLQIFLKNILNAPIKIKPFIYKESKIPEHQKFYLGGAHSVLGKDLFLGEVLPNRSSKFRIQIGPLTKESYPSFLPGGQQYERLLFFTDLFVSEPFEYDIEIIIAEVSSSTCLGIKNYSELGLNTWLFSGNSLLYKKVIFTTI